MGVAALFGVVLELIVVEREGEGPVAEVPPHKVPRLRADSCAPRLRLDMHGVCVGCMHVPNNVRRIADKVHGPHRMVRRLCGPLVGSSV